MDGHQLFYGQNGFDITCINAIGTSATSVHKKARVTNCYLNLCANMIEDVHVSRCAHVDLWFVCVGAYVN